RMSLSSPTKRSEDRGRCGAPPPPPGNRAAVIRETAGRRSGPGGPSPTDRATADGLPAQPSGLSGREDQIIASVPDSAYGASGMTRRAILASRNAALRNS